jgi:UDP-N-acetylmuramate-alanine ligase
VAEVAQEGDMILTLGAGSVSQLGPMILEKLLERTPVQ